METAEKEPIVQEEEKTPEASEQGAEQKTAQEAKKDKSKKKKNREEELQQKLEEAEAFGKKQKEQLLRTAAEYDNFRKRTEREKSAVYADATADAVKEILNVADNLERALAQQECSVEDLRKGVEMVQAQMCAALDKLGVTAMGEVGEAFDPAVHNAVSHVEDEAACDNVVTQVFQKGYKIGDKVIRYAMVQVAN